MCGGGGLHIAHSRELNRAELNKAVNGTEQKAAPKFCSAFLWEPERSGHLLSKQSSFPAATSKDTSISASGGVLVRDGSRAPSSLTRFHLINNAAV